MGMASWKRILSCVLKDPENGFTSFAISKRKQQDIRRGVIKEVAAEFGGWGMGDDGAMK